MKVFLSYSSKDDVISNELDDSLLKYGANIFRDKRELEPLQNITTFMQSISKMDYAIMLISPNYLKSKPCVFEFSEYLKKQDARASLVPVLMDGVGFSNQFKNEILQHIDAEASAGNVKRTWLDKLLNRPVKSNEKAEDWKQRFLTVWNFLTDTKLFNFGISKSKDFSDILTFMKLYDEEIKQQLKEIEKLTDLEEQDVALANLLKKHPGEYWLIRQRATLCTKQKKYKKAIFFFEEFMSKFSDPFDKISTYYDIGVCYYKMGNYEDSIKSHEAAISIEPFTFLSYRGLGDDYMKLEKKDLAYDNYLYSNLFQKNYLVLNNLGAIACERGNYAESMDFFNEAALLNDEDAITYLNIALTYKQQNNLAAYIDTLRIAYQKFPDDYRVLTNYVIQFSNLEESTYTIDELIKILRKSFKINPDYIDTRMYLGYLLMMGNFRTAPNPELEFARKLLTKSLDMNPTKMQERFIVSHLKILLRLLKDNYTLGVLENKYP